MAFLSGYTKRKAITISNTYVDGDLSNYPLNVSFVDDPDVGAFIDSQGLNIRFTDSDGTTLLSYERQAFSVNGSNEATGIFWVKVPSITASSGASIYMYYEDGVGSDGEDATNVWDANFIGVWHMETDPASPVPDSTSGTHNLTSDGTMGPSDVIPAFANLGNGIDFNGTDEGLTNSDVEFDLTSQVTLEAWGRIKESIEDESIYHKWSGGNGYTLQTSGPLFLAIGSSATTNIASTSTTMSPNTDYYMVGTYDGANLQCYLDGLPDGSPVSHTGLDNSGNSLSIARRSDVSGFTDAERTACRLDELRISSIARSSEWVKFTYNNILNNTNSFGAEELDVIFGSGGAVGGSSADVQLLMTEIVATGGTLGGGASDFYALFDLFMSNGATAGSAADFYVLFDMPTSGGSLANGDAFWEQFNNIIMDGGVLGAGDLNVDAIYNPMNNTGIAGAGVAINTMYITEFPAGGSLAAGTVNTDPTLYVQRDIIPENGVFIGLDVPTDNALIPWDEGPPTPYACHRGPQVSFLKMVYASRQHGSRLFVRSFKPNSDSALVATITVCQSKLDRIAKYKRLP